jgi:Peptidase propeptide and YPEB domain
MPRPFWKKDRDCERERIGAHRIHEFLLRLAKTITHSDHVHVPKTRLITSGGIRSVSMKHINMSVPRDCGIRYGALSLALLFACPAFAYTGEKLAKNAKVSIAEARAIAMKAHPGKITDEELEKEKGGSGLRYSFDIKTAAGIQEVGVDAKTGAVLENAKEGKNPD